MAGGFCLTDGYLGLKSQGMQQTKPVALSEAKQWWEVVSTGLRRKTIQTRSSSFAYYEDACSWAIEQKNKGFSVTIEERHAIVMKEVEMRPGRDCYDWHLGAQKVWLSEAVVLPWEVGQILGGN